MYASLFAESNNSSEVCLYVWPLSSQEISRGSDGCFQWFYLTSL